MTGEGGGVPSEGVRGVTGEGVKGEGCSVRGVR